MSRASRQFCERAWQEFQAIETAGGIVESLRSGLSRRILPKRAGGWPHASPRASNRSSASPAFKAAAEPHAAIEPAIPLTPRPRIAAAILIEPHPRHALGRSLRDKRRGEGRRMSRIPDFATVPFAATDMPLARGPAPGRRRKESRQARLSRRRFNGPCAKSRLSGIAAFPARPLRHHVCHPALDHPPICGVLDGGGFERLLPAQSGAGPDGTFRSPSICRRIAAMTPIIRALQAMSAWRAWRSIRSSTCARSSTAFRSTR